MFMVNVEFLKKMKLKRLRCMEQTCLALLLGLLVSNCKDSKAGLFSLQKDKAESIENVVKNPGRSVYYWRTSFKISNEENKWMEESGVEKMYLRLFDVTMHDEHPMPQATIRFDQKVSVNIKEVIPTVFVEEKVLEETRYIKELAGAITKRINAMSQTHEFEYREVQIDCDWTARTQEKYFNLLREMRKVDSLRMFSATIRLHQLAMEAPPVDYGALMLYNTGDFRTANGKDSHNPILDSRDVKPYLKYLKDYPLPLCAAYPNFTWQLVYAGEEFKGILYGDYLGDSTLFKKVDDRKYKVIGSRSIAMQMGRSVLHLFPGEEVVLWRSDAKERLKVAEMVEKERGDINKQKILYHLEEGFLTKEW